MRRPIVAGNWKMNLTLREATALVQQLKASCQQPSVDVVVCPSFTALSAIGQLLQGSAIGLGAQDLFWEPQGAYTGEVSPAMLTDAGCRYVIIGHSERRTYFHETDQSIQRKLRAALQQGLTPIVCIGETLAEREAGKTFDVLTRQLSGGLGGCAPQELKRLVLAYEPVWAIGTGKTATPEQAQEAHAFIRRWLATSLGVGLAESVRIQYGGSVTATNAATLLQQPDIDGALVGGASLNADAFTTIVNAAVAATSKAVAS